MAVTDISDFPWAECNLVENRSIYSGDTLNLRRLKRGKGHHRMEFELVTIDMDPDEQGRGVKAKLSDACDGDLSFIHPNWSYTRGIEPSTGINTNAELVRGQRDLAFTSTQSWQLKSGDYIQFETHTKVYEVVEDTATGTGTKVLRLTSPIRLPVPQGSRVIVNDVQWLLVSDGVIEFQTEANDNQDMSLTLNVVEKL